MLMAGEFTRRVARGRWPERDAQWRAGTPSTGLRARAWRSGVSSFAKKRLARIRWLRCFGGRYEATLRINSLGRVRSTMVISEVVVVRFFADMK